MIDPQVSNFYVGDALALLQQIPDGCVQMVVTSPPYWGLRDYGVKGQMGLEQTPEEYVANMVVLFREIRRVLTDDGTLWLNIGDSYAGSRSGPQGETGEFADREVSKHRAMGGKTKGAPKKVPRGSNFNQRYHGTQSTTDKQSEHADSRERATRARPEGLKHKDMVGIPWRLAFALQADGWYLRKDIIWHKPNAMPESVTDRPSSSHEYVFLLAKSHDYFYDADKVRSPLQPKTLTTFAPSPKGKKGKKAPALFSNVELDAPPPAAREDFEAWLETGAFVPRAASRTRKSKGTDGLNQIASHNWALDVPERKPKLGKNGKPAGANLRSVWSIATTPYKEAHFATFPPQLAETCILATSKPGDLVLDPFFGSGTTGMVAETHGRRWIGLDISAAYCEFAKARTAQRSLKMGG